MRKPSLKSRSERGSTETQPLAENEAFEGPSQYDTFTNEDNAFEMEELGENENEEQTDGKTDDLAAELLESLPSSQFRKIRNMQDAEKLFDELDEEEDGSSAHIISDVTPNDVYIDDENLVIHGMDSSNVDQLREMTTTLKSKKSVRLRVQENEKKAGCPVSGWMEFKYNNSMKVRRAKTKVKDFVLSMNIWNGHMKEIEGLFGTGVLSYFTFLRWLLYLNLLVSILLLCFLFVPQYIHDGFSNPFNETFTGLELLTGEGWFTHTKLYYGSYTSVKINNKYGMQAAYFLVAGGYLLLCVIILAASMAESYKQNYIVGGESITPYSSKVFCSWDYAITNPDTAKIRMLSIAQDMLESLGSSLRGVKSYTCSKLMFIAFIRVSMNLLALALMAGSIYLIVFISDREVDFSSVSHNMKGLIPAVTISVLNLILPSAFRLIASIENYQLAKTELQVTLVRTIILKLASLTAYVVALHAEIMSKDSRIGSVCWETYVGEAFYKLLVIDFLFTLLSLFFGEFIRKIFSKHMSCCAAYTPGFDISRNVLDLIYSQGVCWLGTFYCPLLPVIHVIKLVITFYLKKISAVQNCRPSMRPFKASKMHVVFLALLSLMLMLALIVIGFVIIDDNNLKPSLDCGPFRGTNRIYDVVTDIINDDLSEIKEVIEVISSLTFVAVFFFLVSLLAYYFRMKKQSNEKKIKLLKHQLSLAGQDKQFLLAKLRYILKEQPHVN